jgi:hypothetical protein
LWSLPRGLRGVHERTTDQEPSMKTIRLAAALVALCAFSGQTFAADCAAQATEKKLAGAAKTSFVKKCEKDAMMANPGHAACAKTSDEKKLAGAAQSSFMKKCMADAGSAAPAMAASGAKK